MREPGKHEEDDQQRRLTGTPIYVARAESARSKTSTATATSTSQEASAALTSDIARNRWLKQ